MKKRSRRKDLAVRSWTFLLLLGLLCNLSLKANDEVNSRLRQSAITGIVTDSDSKEALPGVAVTVKGTTRGVVTDLDGAYTIEAQSGETLVFSFIGYITEEVAVGNQSEISVLLSPDAIDLSEIVVIGYGTTKKEDITGAISTVSEEQIKSMPIASVDQALQGKAAGVIVQSTSGSPAGGVSVLVRGASSINASSQPLYIIDGIIINNSSTGGIANISGGQGGQVSNPLAGISTDDIQSINILKDASATAIYGARGANGVIQITTKRGTEGTNKFSFSSYYGVQQLPNKLPVLNTMDYAKYRLIGHMNSINRNSYPNYENQLDPTDSQIPFTTLHPDSLTTDTDWQDEAYRNATIQNYHLSAYGGTEKSSYSISAGYYSVEGILVGSSYDRLSLKANVDTKLKKWLDFGNSLMASYTKEDMSFNDAYYNGGMVERILQQRPDMPVYDENGELAGPPPGTEDAADNPIAAELEKQDDNVVSRLVANVYAQFNIIEGLTFKTSFGSDLSNARTTLFNPSISRGAIYSPTAEMQEATKTNVSWNWDNYFTYTKSFANTHNFNLVGGYNRTYIKWDQFSAYRDDFPSDDIRNLNLGSTANMQNGAYAGNISMVGYLARLIYSYKDYLVFTGSVRRDSDSRFGGDYKWGTFPSAALAWKVSSHSFMSNIPAINLLKLRVGYGQTGNSNVDGVPYLAQLQPVEVTFNNSIYPAYEPAGKSNPDLHWETGITYNVGIDVNFLDNKFQVTSDIYNKRSTEMLIVKPVPYISSPFGYPWSNEAEMVNKGFELSIISNNISRTFTWSSQLTYSYNKNEVLDLGGTEIQKGITTIDPVITNTAEGYPVSQFYGYVTDGLFKTQDEINTHAYQTPNTDVGDIRFKDLNGDGKINDDDKAFIGNPLPMHVFGFTNDFSYKGFEINLFLQGMAGNKVFNWTRRNMEGMVGTENQFQDVMNTYVPEDIYLRTDHGDFLVAEQNTDTDMPRINSGDYNNNRRISDRYVEDGSFLKIQSLTFGYTFPERISNKIGASRLKLYVSGKNLYTFTKYSGYEPEHGNLNNDPLLTGIDIGNYPIPRSVIFGVNLDF